MTDLHGSNEPGYQPTKIPPELMDEMVIRVEERIGFKQKFGPRVSRLNLALAVFDNKTEGDSPNPDAALGLAEAVDAFLTEWRTL